MQRASPSVIDQAADSSDGSDFEPVDKDPTPLVSRLRSRTASNLIVKELDSDHEADSEADSDDEGGSSASPQPRRALRSRDRAIDSDVPMIPASTRKVSRPERSAKTRALEALKAVDSDGTTDVDRASSVDAMTVDEDVEASDDEESAPGPLTRSQLRAAVKQEGAFAPRHTRRQSTMSIDSTEISISDGDENESDDDANSIASSTRTTDSMSTVGEVEMQDATAAMERTTRSGKTFGSWQSRKKRLRQEAIDDPEMEAEEEDDEDEDDEEDSEGTEEEEEEFETGEHVRRPEAV